jgi:hypothetical protein
MWSRGVKIFAGLLIGAILSCAISADAAYWQGQTFANGNGGNLNQWNVLKIGAATAVSHLSINQSDNTILAAPNQPGCYVANASTYPTPPFSNIGGVSNLPVGAGVDTSGFPIYAACDELRSAPSNSSDLWALYNGLLYYSVNKGTTFAQATGFAGYNSNLAPEHTQNAISTNAPWIAIDPANPSVVYSSTPGQGLFSTAGGGTGTFAQVTAVGNALTSGYPTVGTDSGSITTCTGTVSFTHNSTNLGLQVGESISVYETANSLNSMFGTVSTASVGDTFSLLVISNTGTCSHSDWTVSSPNQIGGGSVIAFDPSVPPSGGKSPSIYTCTYGVGCFHSANAGATWTQISNGSGNPKAVTQIDCDPNGTLWAIEYFGDNTTGHVLWTYNGSSWTNSTETASVGAIAVDHLNCASEGACHVAMTTDFEVYYTANGGSSWNFVSGKANFSFTAPTGDVGWLGGSFIPNFNYFGMNAITWDNAGNLWVTSEGIYELTPTTSATNYVVTVRSAGIEGFEVFQLLSANPGQVILSGYDVGVFVTSSLNSYPSATSGYTPNPAGLRHAYMTDYVAGTPSTLINLADQGTYETYEGYSGISTTSGGTWSALNPPPIATACSGGGCVAGSLCASSTSDFLWMPSDGVSGGVAPYRTINGGAAWTQISVTGVTSGWPSFYANYVVSCAADRTTPDKYYLYNVNGGASGFNAIVTCASGSCSITYDASQLYTVNTGYNSTLKTPPAVTDLYFTAGQQAGPHPVSTPFYMASSSSGPFNAITGFKEVTAYGFGATFPGQSYASFYVNGFFTGTVICQYDAVCGTTGSYQSATSLYGIYMCKGFNASTQACSTTWEKIGSSYPCNSADVISSIDGDKSTPGLVYVGYTHGGACYAQFNYLLNRDLDPASNNNSPAFLNMVG